ncbi:hypothetical protein ACROYT_G025343 [Oculina patagonica]
MPVKMKFLIALLFLNLFLTTAFAAKDEAFKKKQSNFDVSGAKRTDYGMENWHMLKDVQKFRELFGTDMRQLIKYVTQSDVKLAPLVESSDKENLDLQILIKDQDDLKMASFTQEHIYCLTDVNFSFNIMVQKKIKSLTPLNKSLIEATITVQQRTSSAEFTEEQISEIKRLVQDAVASASRDIARGAARVDAQAMQSQVPSSLPSPSHQAVCDSNPGGVHILRPQEQQKQAGQRLYLNDGPHLLAPCRYRAPFQDVPASYVKEILSGEFFFYLSKLHTKNLSLHYKEDNLVLSLDNSVIKVSKNTRAFTSISLFRRL